MNSKTMDAGGESTFPGKLCSGWLPVLAVAVLGFAIYSNSFDCSFHYDDYSNIVENGAIRDVSDVGEIWNFLPRRFVGYLTFALNYRFGGLDVFGYHLVNVLIHIGAALLVMYLSRMLLSAPGMRPRELGRHSGAIAFWCGMVFLAHPIQTQAVTYIVQRLASLAALFYLGSLALYVKARLSEGRTGMLLYAGSACAALLGMFTKENVITLPFAVILVEACFLQSGTKRALDIVRSIKFWVTAIPFLAFLLILPALFSFNLSAFFHPTFSHRQGDPQLTSFVYFISQFRVLVTYIRLLVLPVGQNLDHDIPASDDLFALPTLGSLVFLTALLAAAVFVFPRNRPVAFGIFWFFLTLSVESSFKPLNNIMFEHRLYLPMFGVSLGAVSGVWRLAGGRRPVQAVVVLLLVVGVYSVMTYRRNMVWKDEITLWSDAVKKSPRKARARYNLAYAYEKAGRLEEAKKAYAEAIELYPAYVDALHNLGSLLSMEGKYDEAKKYYSRALDIEPGFVKSYLNLGNDYFRRGRYDEAARAYETALAHDPNYVQAHINLGMVCTEKGDYDRAREELEKARVLDGENFEVYFRLGNVAYREGRFEEAAEHYRKSLRLNPGYVPASRNLGNSLYKLGRGEEALRVLEDALEKNPGDAALLKTLGLICSRIGKADRAAVYLERALEIQPDPETYCDLGMLFHERGEDAEAVKRFEAALRLAPGYVNAHMKAAVCYKALGDEEKARRHIDEADRLLKKRAFRKKMPRM